MNATIAVLMLASVGAGCWIYFHPTEINSSLSKSAPASPDNISLSESQREVRSTKSKAASSNTFEQSRAAKLFDEVPGQFYAVKNLAGQFDRLSEQAKDGDLVAAKTLYRFLSLCKHAPHDMDTLDKLRNKFQAKGDSRGFEFQRFLYDHCGTLVEKQFEQSSVVVGQLAEAGDSDARLAYPATARPTDYDSDNFSQEMSEFQRKAKDYLNIEIAKGNELALLSTAQAYTPPIVTSQAIPFEDNPLLAYEYFYAYGLTSKGQNQNDGITGQLASLESKLSLDEVASARTRAQAIFEQCCKK